MSRRAFTGLVIIETMLAFGNTFAASFNLIYLFKEFDLPLWAGSAYLGIGFGISILVSLWMSWKPHIDPRNAIIFGLAWLCLEYTIFMLVRDPWVISLTVGVAFGVYYPFFWTPFNVLMARMTDKNDRGVKYGVFFFIWPLATFIAPLLGGLVIEHVNYAALFALGIIIIVLTAIVVALYRPYIPKDQVMRIDLRGIGLRNAVATYGEGGFEGIFWVGVTLIAYVYSQDEVSLGALFSLFGLSAGVMAIILGRISDKIQNRVFFLRASAVASIPCAVLVYLANSLESYAIANGLLEFACFSLAVFMFAILTDRLEDAKNNSVLTREFLLDIGRTGAIALLMVLLYIGWTPQQVFLLCIPFLVMMLASHELPKRARILTETTGQAP